MTGYVSAWLLRIIDIIIFCDKGVSQPLAFGATQKMYREENNHQNWAYNKDTDEYNYM